MKTATKPCADATYRAVKKDLKFLACQFGGPEVMSEIHEHFMKAFLSYNPERGASIRTWIVYKVRKQLMQSRRCFMRRRLPMESGVIGNVVEHHHFNLRRFLFELSGDARIVINLALYDEVIQSQHTYHNRRVHLFRHLSSQGWSSDRIYKTFEEIRSAL
jgi:hypothetical protein